MAATPAEMLPVLAKMLNERMPRIRKNRQYSTGKAPMPEMGGNTRASWEKFQKQARTDYGGLVCRSLASRVRPLGLTVGDDDSPEVRALRRVWRDNRLALVFGDAVWTMLSTSVGYILTERRADGQPVITSERPEQMITLPNRAQPWRSEAALKVRRDKVTGRDYATVWLDTGEWQSFGRSAKNFYGTFRGDVTGDWEPITEVLVNPAGGVPVQVLDNAGGVAEFEPHIDVIDRINHGKLNRLVVAAMQAFKQRAVKGDLPAEDEDGNSIDYDKVFEAAPGALWDLPEGIDIWESKETDVRPLLEAEKTDARDFAAVSQTNISVFLPDGQNQSAEGASNAKEAEIGKAENRIEIVRPAIEGALLEALKILKFSLDESIEVQFAPPAYVSLSEKSNGAAQAKNAGMSRRWIAKNIWGLTPDEINRNETDLAAEQLAEFSAAVPDIDAQGVGSADVKSQSDALGVLIRAGVDPVSAAAQVGLTGVKFTGAVPVSLRLPTSESDVLEEK